MDRLEYLKSTNEAPEWLTEEGLKTLEGGYFQPGETPKTAWQRVAKAAAKISKRPDIEASLFEVMWKNWLCLATPVMSNLGTNRGLPISCNSIHPDDSVDSIFQKSHELAVLSKNGAGVGIYLGDIRGRGAPIAGNGTSEGIVPWAKVYDTATIAVNQGSRRGASAVYLPVRHSDIEEFINIRRPTGDMNRRCMNLHHAVCIDDEFMSSVEKGTDEKDRELFKEILKARFETGEPYLFFSDNVNRQRPEAYIKNNLIVKTSNICNEIYLYTDPDHTLVCCLSSLNLFRYDEWKDWVSPEGMTLVELTTRLLDAVLEEYITKASKIRGLEAAVRFAVKSRAIGIGVLGWHSLLQSKKLPFDSYESMALNAKIFKQIRDESKATSAKLAVEYGEPEWCQGTGMRNTHTMAVAPTVSNSAISGSLSAGIEPLAANWMVLKSSKGTFFRKNKQLELVLEQKNKNTSEIWNGIAQNEGSVQHLSFLSAEEKEVFLTAREINQFAIIKQAAQRQKFIDQGQSVNLFFGKNADPKYVYQVHMEAWRSGLKGLYYCRAESVLKGDFVNRQSDECKACEA